MKMHIKPAMFWSSYIVSFLLILSIAMLCSGQEVEDEREFDYVEGSEKGPALWGDIKREWRTCKTGKLQSPIDLLHTRVTVIPNSEKIAKFYKLGKAVLKNRGHDIEIEWKDKNSKIEVNGTNYILSQAHWHSPSEHTINGSRFDVELHLVHKTSDDKVAVIGLLYKIGKPNKFLSTLIKKIESISDSNEEIGAGKINPQRIKMEGNRYYRYMGSLTTPPCTENVLWTVNKQIGTISEKQVKILREAVHDHAEKNARPLQDINGRKVKLYDHQIKNYPC